MEIQYIANVCARKEGFNAATKITFKNIKNPEIIETKQFGYRKYTTGEYVPNAYRAKFGWKNTYYQNVVCVVALPLRYKKWL
jgi:hypothetical protein